MKDLKLKGWVDGILSTRSRAEIATAHWFAVKPVPDMVKATLVIGDERVFTESEVKSKDEDMKWALNWINNEAKHLRERGEPQEALEVALEMMLERHGIVLDPA